MNSSELYDTLVSLDEKYTEEAETFLFTNKGDFTKNAQCKGIKTNRLTGVAVSIAIIPLLAVITVFYGKKSFRWNGPHRAYMKLLKHSAVFSVPERP